MAASSGINKDYTNQGSYIDTSNETIYYASSSTSTTNGSPNESEPDSPETTEKSVDYFSIVCENTVRKILSTTKRGYTTIQILKKFQKYMIPLDMELYDRVKNILDHMDMCVSEKVGSKVFYSIRRCRQCKIVISTVSQIHKDWKNVCVQCIQKKTNKYKCFYCKRNKNNNNKKTLCKQCEENKKYKSQ